jgi:hypothetical protein
MARHASHWLEDLNSAQSRHVRASVRFRRIRYDENGASSTDARCRSSNQAAQFRRELRYRSRAGWQPLLRPIVALNGNRYGVDGAVVTTSGVQVSMRLNLALGAQEQFQEWVQSRRRASPTLDYGKFAFGFESDATPEPVSGSMTSMTGRGRDVPLELLLPSEESKRPRRPPVALCQRHPKTDQLAVAPCSVFRCRRVRREALLI